MEILIEEVIKRFVAVRDEAKVSAKAFSERIDTMERYIERYMAEQNLKSFRTDAGTVVKTVRRSARIDDPEAFYLWAELHPEFVKRSLDSTAVLDHIDSDQELPPGVTISSAEVLSVRS